MEEYIIVLQLAITIGQNYIYVHFVHVLHMFLYAGLYLSSLIFENQFLLLMITQNMSSQ